MTIDPIDPTQPARLRQLSCPTLPLAVYREVVAHLQQVDGISAGLVAQSAPDFDYDRSQVGYLWLQYPENADATTRQQVDRILAYYGDRYGVWERV
jgi:hypothetical protein